MTEKSIKIRCLCSAKDASSTWDLHCELREKMVRFVADLEDGKHLAQERINFKNLQQSDLSSFRESETKKNRTRDN